MRYSCSGDFQESAARARSAAILQRSLPSRPSGNSPAPSGSASPPGHPTAVGQMANVCGGSVHKSKSRIPQEREQTRYRLLKERKLERRMKGTKLRSESEDLTENRGCIFKMVFTANVCTKIVLALLFMNKWILIRQLTLVEWSSRHRQDTRQEVSSPAIATSC